MLMAIRDRVMGIVGWLLLGALFIAFAFFGLNSYFTSSGKTYAAKVNGVEIPIPVALSLVRADQEVLFDGQRGK